MANQDPGSRKKAMQVYLIAGFTVLLCAAAFVGAKVMECSRTGGEFGLSGCRR